MACKDILVFLDAEEDRRICTDAAADLAERLSVRPIGLDVCTYKASDGEALAQARTLRSMPGTGACSAQVKTVFRTASPDARPGRDSDAHCADLIVVIGPYPEGEHAASSPPYRVICSWARAFPRWCCGTSGVAMRRPSTISSWPGTPVGGSRAMHEATPLLVAAGKSSLVDADADARLPDLTDVREHLARHGANVEVADRRGTDEVDVFSLLSACLDGDRIDLVVAGSHGRSHLV